MRNKRIDIGWLGEIFEDPRHKILKADTATHKGDLLTKEFSKDRFQECKKLVGLTLICCNGELQTVEEFLAAAASRAEAEAQKDSLKAGVNSWVVDTGSGHNLVPKTSLSEQEKASLRDAQDVLTLATANGVIKAKQTTTSRVSELGSTVESRVLSSTPRVLSVHYLVTQRGATFSWSPNSGASLLLDGKLHHLPVKQGVPLLALPAIVK